VTLKGKEMLIKKMKTSSYLEKGLWKTYSEIQGSGIGKMFSCQVILPSLDVLQGKFERCQQ
jgi:hypothetical protein